jgi:folate-dependent tRNA-U54 methylase TrmFO/GidA
MMRRLGSLCVALGLVVGAGCTPRAPGEREIEVKPLDPLAEARTILQRYADGQPMSSEASTFPDLVAKVREKDAKKADILEKGLDDLQKAPPGARPGKAKELLKKLE